MKTRTLILLAIHYWLTSPGQARTVTLENRCGSFSSVRIDSSSYFSKTIPLPAWTNLDVDVPDDSRLCFYATGSGATHIPQTTFLETASSFLSTLLVGGATIFGATWLAKRTGAVRRMQPWATALVGGLGLAASRTIGRWLLESARCSDSKTKPDSLIVRLWPGVLSPRLTVVSR